MPLVVMAALGACPSRCGPPPPPSVSTVIVTFPNVPQSERPLLLYSGARDGVCRLFEPFVGTTSPTVTLTDVQYDPSCPVEIDVLAPGWGTYGSTVDPTDAVAVTAWADARTSGTMPVPLPALTPVPVTVWILAGTPAKRKAAHDAFDEHLGAAASILEGMGAGLTLGIPTPVDLAPGQVSPDCAKADAISNAPSTYNAATLNVYYVENYLDQPFSNYGMTCWMDGHPEIVFISWGNPYTVAPILAHEVGHAVGLFHPEYADGLGVGGHTNNVPGFDDDNLMSTGASAVNNVSIGQSYALNFSSGSFFNRPGSTMTRPVVRACQDSWGAGLCPVLAMFVAGWPK